MFWDSIIQLFVIKQLLLYVSCLPEDLLPLPIAIRNGPEHGIVIDISHVSLSPSARCSLMYRRINNSEGAIRLDYTPQLENYTLELNNLQPHTTYDLFLSCEENNRRYQSKHVTFTTAGDSSGRNVTSQRPSYSASPPPDGSTELPDVEQERVYAAMNPVDVAAGILFGALGLGILGAIAYHFGKKIRHRQRIQRFLQYREQEYDAFPVLEQREDDDLTT